MFNTGDVISFFSEVAAKKKYHLCLHVDGIFLFLNSQKARTYPGDLAFPASEFPFLPQESESTIISCTYVIYKTQKELVKEKAVKVGEVGRKHLKTLNNFVRACDALTENEKSVIIDALADYI